MRLTSTGLPIHGKTTSPPRQATTLLCEARPRAKWRTPGENGDWGFKKTGVFWHHQIMMSRLTQQCVVGRVSMLRFTNL